jgi:hypothetical protein
VHRNGADRQESVEVVQHGPARAVDEHVRRLDIAVNRAQGMEPLDGDGERAKEHRGGFSAEWRRFDDIGKCPRMECKHQISHTLGITRGEQRVDSGPSQRSIEVLDLRCRARSEELHDTILDSGRPHSIYARMGRLG